MRFLSPIIFLLALGVACAKEPVDKVKTTSSGLKYEILTPGDGGGRPVPGDKVTVHYTGRLTDGQKFDSSVDRDEPFEFMLGVGKVIEGWDEGVALMSIGEKVRLTIPWRLAYGEQGSPPKIPPKADLVFEVELLSVTKGEPLAVFRKADPESQKTTESGLKVEVLAAGEGGSPNPHQGVSARFTLWNTEGRHILSTASTGMRIAGPVGSLKLGRFSLPFLSEALLMMKPGARLRCEVPPALAFGNVGVHPELPADSVTIWELELDKVNAIPEFSLSADENLRKTASGLAYEVVKEGKGESPKATEEVTVHYSGWLTDGKLFDSSHARGEPSTFPLNRVIRGWTEGLELMRPGAVYRFTIPGNLAYGADPRPGSGIPPNATLVFLVELIRIGK